MLQAADLTIRLHPDDDVVIARVELPAGTLVTKENVRSAVRIPPGHKLAVRDVVIDGRFGPLENARFLIANVLRSPDIATVRFGVGGCNTVSMTIPAVWQTLTKALSRAFCSRAPAARRGRF